MFVANVQAGADCFKTISLLESYDINTEQVVYIAKDMNLFLMDVDRLKSDSRNTHGMHTHGQIHILLVQSSPAIRDPIFYRCSSSIIRPPLFRYSQSLYNTNTINCHITTSAITAIHCQQNVSGNLLIDWQTVKVIR